MKKTLLVLIAFVIAAGASLWSQSLKDNSYYQKSLELQAQASQAFDDGDYDAAAAYAAQAQQYAGLSDKYVAQMVAMTEANESMAKAKDALAAADKLEAAKYYPKEYASATTAMADSETAYGSQDYATAKDRADAVLVALADVKEADTWPAVYVVRLIPARRDCLWRIAEYPFIYNNPFKWPVIYEANKKTFRDPSNPNLIFPGQKLQIPVIAGEKRDGTYDPAKEYKPFPKK